MTESHAPRKVCNIRAPTILLSCHRFFFPQSVKLKKNREFTLFYKNCNIQPKRKPDESLKKINIASFLSQFAKKSKKQSGGEVYFHFLCNAERESKWYWCLLVFKYCLFFSDKKDFKMSSIFCSFSLWEDSINNYKTRNCTVAAFVNNLL